MMRGDEKELGHAEWSFDLFAEEFFKKLGFE